MIINSYIAKNIIKATFSNTLVICGTIVMLRSLNLLDYIINSSINLNELLLLILSTLPRIFAITLPFAIFISTFSVYDSLRIYSELNILKNIGFSNIQLLKPVFYTSIIFMILSLTINMFIAPIGKVYFEKTEKEAINKIALGAFQSGKFIAVDTNNTVYAREKKGAELIDIMIFQKKHTGDEILFAKSGGIVDEENKSTLVLRDGTVQVVGKNSASLSFQKNLIEFKKNINSNINYRNFSYYTIFDLVNFIKNDTNINKSYKEIITRIVSSVMIFLSSLLGVLSVLVIKYKRTDSKKPMLISGGILLLYATATYYVDKQKYTNDLTLSYFMISILLVSIFVIITYLKTSEKIIPK